MSQTLDAVLHKGQTMPEKNRFPAVLQPIGYDILGTPASEVAKATDVHTPLRSRTPGQHENSTTTMIAQPVAYDIKGGLAPHSNLVGSEIAYALKVSDHKDVQAIVSVALRGRDGGATAELGDETSYALRAAAGGGSDPYVLAPIIGFSCKDHGGDATEDNALTMRAMGHSGSHANAGGQLAVVVHGTQETRT